MGASLTVQNHNTFHDVVSREFGNTSRSGFSAVRRLSARLYRLVGKRALDLALVLLFAPFAFGLIACLAALAASDGRNPFYVQPRVGRNGRVFHMLKIRTMVPDAEAKLDAYLAENPEAWAEWETKQKLDHDPRITRFGHAMRRLSLDELPQLWNVLRGDMSIVGPRPMMTCQKSLYPGRAYTRLRPGITGNWQVSDRNATSFAARADYDTQYFVSLSLRQDLLILLKTAGVVLRATGR